MNGSEPLGNPSSGQDFVTHHRLANQYRMKKLLIAGDRCWLMELKAIDCYSANARIARSLCARRLCRRLRVLVIGPDKDVHREFGGDREY